MRIFISVELPDEVKKNVTELVNELKTTVAGAKWIKPENLHITLKFLGWVEDRKLDNLIELSAKSAAGAGSFKARFEGLGTFPEGKTPRVIWVGTVEGGDELCKLAKNLEETLSKAGFRGEEREFKPHLTIGRVKDKKGIGNLMEKIGSTKNAKFGEAFVDNIYIMKSTLTPSGPIYDVISVIKL
jgi:2'-5' RNA ligase